MHTGVSLKIDDLILSFDKDIDIAIDELKAISNKIQVVDVGNIVFNDLKLVIASNDAMGGEGNNIGYVYISNDISHLLVG
jgi:hypothetical protein